MIDILLQESQTLQGKDSHQQSMSFIQVVHRITLQEVVNQN